MEPRTFEGEKDLLTATMKKRRDKLINRYKVVKVFSTIFSLGVLFSSCVKKVYFAVVQAGIDNVYKNLIVNKR